MKIAVIMGASSVLGYEYAIQISKHFRNIEEIWLIDNEIERMAELTKVIHNKKLRRISLDLSKEESYDVYKELLRKNSARVKILVNGEIYIGNKSFEKASYNEIFKIININCKTMVAITKITIPYMYYNSYILNVASIMGYIPNADFLLYSSISSMIMNFSLALNREMKNKGVKITTVLLSEVISRFLSMENKNVIFDIDILKRIVNKSLRDAVLYKKNISVYGFKNKILLGVYKSIPYNIFKKFYKI